MNSSEHAFVIGGGPAGLVAAIALRRKGLQVTVADGGSAPGDKACGEGILPDGLSALQRLGITLDPSEGHSFRGIRFVNARTTAEATFPSHTGLGLRRVVLHRQLMHAAEQSGVRLLWRTPVTGIEERRVLLGQKEILADWIIGADGYRSRVRHWAGLMPREGGSFRYAFRQHFACAPWTDFVEVHWAAHAQLYITPVTANEVGVVALSRNPQLRLKDALASFPAVARRFAHSKVSTTERGALTGNAALSAVHGGRIAVIGDASGTVDAITGEGLSIAFQQAEALAAAIAQGSLASYGVAHARLRRRPAWMARLLLLLERHPWLQERALKILAAEPELFRRMLAAHVGHSSPFSFAAAGARLGWLILAA